MRLCLILSLSILFQPFSSKATLLVNPATDGGMELGAGFPANGWTVVNATTNQWFASTFVFNAGTRSAYIANDGVGANNNYSNLTRVSHFYKDIVVPASENEISISFDWKCLGEPGFDYMRVYVAPTTFTPVINVLPSAIYQISTDLNAHQTWSNITLYSSCYAGSTMRLIFSWRNDGAFVGNPAMAVDNISVISTNAFATPPANDLPCAATALPLGVPTTGDNRCAGNAAEPAAGTCWTNGGINTVWYTVVCPVSGSLLIRTSYSSGPNILKNSQIALYSGVCAGLAEVACNDNVPLCGNMTYVNSQISVGALVPGATYWISVDGYGDQRGIFSIVAIDGATALPTVPGQDCSSPSLICNVITPIGNPGYQAIGNYCDFGAGGNCTTGEKGSVWFQINIALAGNLMFTILPNDYNGVCLDETDYDFVLWKIVGAGAVTCAGITASAGGGALRCNYDAAGVTGLFTGGNSPAPYAGACFNNAFETPLPVVAAEVYLLCVTNFANSQSGFSIDFTNSSAGTVSYTPPTSVTWTGGASTTTWTTNNNWGGCNAPSCTVDGIVTTASFFQPVLNAPGPYQVNNLTINPGASLTLNAGVTLQICGNFTNNGNLIFFPTSTVEFIGAGAQNVTGSFTAGNALGNLTVNKVTGSVILNNAVDLQGNFLTSNITSIFNINAQILKVAGNFTNSTGTTTFTGFAGSTVEMNGTGAQSIGGSTTTFGSLNINKTAGTATLTSPNHIVSTALNCIAGPLNLNLNTLIINTTATTGTSRTAGYVISENTGNLNKIQWNLGAGTGSYLFPWGTAGGVYIPFTLNITAGTMGNVTCSTYPTAAACTPWPITPQPVLNLNSTTGLIPDNQLATDKRFWQIDKSGGSGTADMTFSVTTAELPAPALYNPWFDQRAQRYNTVVNRWEPALPGQTTALIAGGSNVTVPGVTAFSPWALASIVSPLPVGMTVFTGEPYTMSSNLLEWTTASETDNDFFTVQSSSDGSSFSDLGTVDGAGTSSSQHDYQFIDEAPFPGTTYYRLMQTDVNLQRTWSNIISVSREQSGVFNLVPNPTLNGQFSVVLDPSLINKEVLVVVYDVKGEESYSKVIINGSAGSSILVTDPARSLAPGIYIVTASSADKLFMQKLVVLEK